MKHWILVLALATSALSGCAQLKEWYYDTDAQAGASSEEEKRPYPKSSSDLGLF